MKSISLVLMALLSRGFVQAQHEFAFTQCDCENGVFPGTGSVLAGLTNGAITPSGTIDCGADGQTGSNDFPDDAGVQVLSGNLPAGTVTSADIATSHVFILRTELATGDGALSRTLAQLVDSDPQTYLLTANSAGLNLLVGIDSITSATVDIVNTDFIIAFGFFDDGGTSFGYICQGPNVANIDLTCTSSNALNLRPVGDTALTLTPFRANSFKNTLRGFRLETGLSLTQANLEAQIEAAAGRLVQTPVVPPVNAAAVALGFTTVEDNAVTVNLNTLLQFAASGLTFAIDEDELIGTFVTALDVNAGTFTYDPIAEFNGDRAFSMDYGIGDCSNTGIELTLTITPENDPPVPNNAVELEVFAGARKAFSVANIATDVDFFADNNIIPENEATFIVANPPTGVVFSTVGSGGACNTAAATDFPIVDSGVEFCILAPNTLDSGSATVSFDIDDGTVSVQGTLTLNGNTPVRVIDGNRDETQEATAINIDITALAAEEVPEAANFGIRITELPDPALGSLNVALNADVAQTDTLTFTPAANVFNAFDNGDIELSNRGDDDVLIGDCAANERVDGFCPITFKYVATFGDFVSNDEATMSFLVEAVDDLGTVFAAVDPDNLNLIVEADEGDNDAFGSFPEITITSDNGNSVFPVEMIITASGGANFQFTANIAGLEVVNAEFENTVRSDCDQSQCTLATVRTTPNQFPRLLSTAILNVDLDADVVNPEVTMSVAGQNVEVKYTVEINELLFFDDPANVAIVAGGGTGLVALVVGFLLFRVRRADNLKAQREIALAEQRVQEEIALGTVRKPKGKPTSSKKTSGKTKAKGGVEKIGQGWEKHYDPSSKAYFYYNPSTDTTQWDFPEDLNSGSGRKRLLSEEL